MKQIIHLGKLVEPVVDAAENSKFGIARVS